MSVRLCTKCGQRKPTRQFRLRAGKPISCCKPCESQLASARQRRNTVGHRAAVSRYGQKIKGTQFAQRGNRIRHLSRYGLSVADYDRMLTAQKGRCAICDRKKLTARSRRLAVDHCHKSGRVRGLLCLACNSALGLLSESAERCEAMARYIRETTRSGIEPDTV